MKRDLGCLIAVTTGLFVLAGAHNAVPANAALACTAYASFTGNDSNSGTQAAPFRSVGKLMQSLAPGRVGCLKPGDTFESELITVDPTVAPVVYCPWAARVTTSGQRSR